VGEVIAENPANQSCLLAYSTGQVVNVEALEPAPPPDQSTHVSSTVISPGRSKFEIVERTSNLVSLAREEAQTCAAFVCMENGAVVGAITHQQLALYMTTKASELNGMIDLGDHTVSDILDNPAVSNGFQIMPAVSSFFDAVKILKEPKTRVVVAVNFDDGMPVGVVLRTHRRY